MSAELKTTLLIRVLIFAGLILLALLFGIARARTQFARGTTKLGLSAVSLRGDRSALDEIRAAASQIGWTETIYDTKGRLVLAAPRNYASDDFGRLLQAIDPYKSGLEGLQMLGPRGGPVDDKGVEHSDD